MDMVLLPASPLRPDATGSGAYVADDAQGPAGRAEAQRSPERSGSGRRVCCVCRLSVRHHPPHPPTRTCDGKSVCWSQLTSSLQPKKNRTRKKRETLRICILFVECRVDCRTRACAGPQYISHATGAAPGVSLSVGHARGRHLSAEPRGSPGSGWPGRGPACRCGVGRGAATTRAGIRMRAERSGANQRVFCLPTPLFCTYRTVTVQRGT